ncbi:MFS transporter [Actinoplanes sp. NPDC049548]|uniref:MFS transporter n=1 Tax=Actinoplanes sp. NPDC049548 TaxID=3155152 RepID=UPI00342BA3CD
MAPVPLRANRDFRLLWVGGLFSALASQLLALAAPLLVLAQTGSATAAGLVGSVSAVTLLVTALPGGAVADATERRRLMLACQLGAIAVAGLLAVAVAAGRSPVVLVTVTNSAIIALGALHSPATVALLRAAVPADDLATATARMQARTAAARLVGPLVGGALFGMSPALPFVVTVVGLALSIGCLLLVRARAAPRPGAAAPLAPREVVGGLVFLWRQAYLRTILVIFGTGMNMAFSGVMLASIATTAGADHSGKSSGVVVALTAGGSLVGSLLAPRLRVQERPQTVIVLCCWVCAVLVPALALTRAPLVIGLLLAPCMFVAALGNVAFATTMLLLTPPDLTGRVQSAAGFLSMIAQPVGPLVGGVLLDRIGAPATFGVFAAVMAVAAVVVTVSPSAPPVASLAATAVRRDRG